MPYASKFRCKIIIKRDSRIDKLTRAVKLEAGQLTRDTARDLQQAIREEAPEETAAMKASTYVVAGRINDYDRCIAQAERLRPGTQWLPMERITDRATGLRIANIALVAVAAPYGGFINHGTSTRPANPFFDHAVARIIPGFKTDVNNLINEADKNG